MIVKAHTNYQTHIFTYDPFLLLNPQSPLIPFKHKKGRRFVNNSLFLIS